MPRSGYFEQRCKCSTDKQAAISVTLGASSLRTTPRQKSRTITLYICRDCLKNPRPKTRSAIVNAVLQAAKEVTNKVERTQHAGKVGL